MHPQGVLEALLGEGIPPKKLLAPLAQQPPPLLSPPQKTPPPQNPPGNPDTNVGYKYGYLVVAYKLFVETNFSHILNHRYLKYFRSY